MRAFLVGICVLVCVATAEAHRSDTSRVHNMRHIAQSIYGEVCDVGTMAVPIRRVRGLKARTGYNGTFQALRWSGGVLTECVISVDDRRWRTEFLCRVIAGHEFGHAAGLEHSNNPRSIMWPGTLPFWKPCADGAANPQSTRPSPSPKVKSALSTVPGTVILLPGGGWQNAYPSMMQRWADDFEAHGINARAITYPLRDVVAAIDHVREVVKAEPDPVVVYGVSAGGTLAAAIGAEGIVAGAVNLFGPTDFTRWTGAGLIYMQQIGMTTYEQKRAASPYWRLSQYVTPSPQLQQCGLADPLVTYEQCIRYHDGAKKLQPDTRLDPMLNAHDQSPEDRAKAREWVRQHLLAAAGI